MARDRATPFGGRQWCLRCPRTDRRVSVLWKSPGDDRFLSWQHAATNRLRLPIPDLARPGVLGARAARHRLGGSGLCGFNRELSPKPRGCTADIRMRNRADRTPRKWLQSLSGRHYFAFRVRFRLVACACLTVSIGTLYQWTPCLSARPMFRSSAE